MSEDISEKVDLFVKDADFLSIEIMKDAFEKAGSNGYLAVAALTMAAGRAAGYSGLSLGQLTHVFVSQYGFCAEDAKKLVEEEKELPWSSLKTEGGSN